MLLINWFAASALCLGWFLLCLFSMMVQARETREWRERYWAECKAHWLTKQECHEWLRAFGPQSTEDSDEQP